MRSAGRRPNNGTPLIRLVNTTIDKSPNLIRHRIPKASPLEARGRPRLPDRTNRVMRSAGRRPDNGTPLIRLVQTAPDKSADVIGGRIPEASPLVIRPGPGLADGLHRIVGAGGRRPNDGTACVVPVAAAAEQAADDIAGGSPHERGVGSRHRINGGRGASRVGVRRRRRGRPTKRLPDSDHGQAAVLHRRHVGVEDRRVDVVFVLAESRSHLVVDQYQPGVGVFGLSNPLLHLDSRGGGNDVLHQDVVRVQTALEVVPLIGVALGGVVLLHCRGGGRVGRTEGAGEVLCGGGTEHLPEPDLALRQLGFERSRREGGQVSVAHSVGRNLVAPVRKGLDLRLAHVTRSINCVRMDVHRGRNPILVQDGQGIGELAGPCVVKSHTYHGDVGSMRRRNSRQRSTAEYQGEGQRKRRQPFDGYRFYAVAAPSPERRSLEGSGSTRLTPGSGPHHFKSAQNIHLLVAPVIVVQSGGRWCPDPAWALVPPAIFRLDGPRLYGRPRPSQPETVASTCLIA